MLSTGLPRLVTNVVVVNVVIFNEVVVNVVVRDVVIVHVVVVNAVVVDVVVLTGEDTVDRTDFVGTRMRRDTTKLDGKSELLDI